MENGWYSPVPLIPVTEAKLSPLKSRFLASRTNQSSLGEFVASTGRRLLSSSRPSLKRISAVLVQGPYRTTPSRDNIPRDNDWNTRLVCETASLLRETLCWLRDNDFLDTKALRCLPLDSAKFDNTNMFKPLFESTKDALSSDPLLPRFDSGYVAASRARLGRTQELRELFDPTQLADLYEEEARADLAER